MTIGRGHVARFAKSPADTLRVAKRIAGIGAGIDSKGE